MGCELRFQGCPIVFVEAWGSFVGGCNIAVEEKVEAVWLVVLLGSVISTEDGVFFGHGLVFHYGHG